MKAPPYAGQLSRTGPLGYLPQDPREGDLDMTARDRVLSARGLDTLVSELEKVHIQMAELTGAERDAAVERYGRIEERFSTLGGYAAESEAARITSNLGLPDRILEQPMRTLSGGQRRRVELARILFAAADAGDGTMLLLDEPTNHLDADSITWLRDFLKSFSGGLVIISHDVELLAAVVNKVWFLDAVRGELDIYNMTWGRYLEARSTDEQRRRRERANAEKKAAVLITQAAKLGAKATKAAAAHQMVRRAEALISNLDEIRVSDKVAKIRFPEPAPCGKTPLTAKNLSKSYGSLEIFTGVDLAIDRGSRVVVLGFNGAGKTTLLKLLGGREKPDTGAVEPGHGLKIGYYAQEHETLDPDRTGLGEHPQRRSGRRRPGTAEPARHLPVHRGAAGAACRNAVRRGEDPAGPCRSGLVCRQRPVTRRAHQQPGPGQPRAGAGRPPPLCRSRRAGHPRSRRRCGAAPGTGHPAPGRQRGSLVGGLPGSGRTGLTAVVPRRDQGTALRYRWRARWICSIIGGTPTSASTAAA